MCAGFNARQAFNSSSSSSRFSRVTFPALPPFARIPLLSCCPICCAEDFRDFSVARSYNHVEGETRVPIAFSGNVWSKSFRSRMARLHGGIKAREIMYWWYMAFLEFNPLARRRCHVLPLHSSFHAGSV